MIREELRTVRLAAEELWDTVATIEAILDADERGQGCYATSTEIRPKQTSIMGQSKHENIVVQGTAGSAAGF
jgi:hypothetical protein